MLPDVCSVGLSYPSLLVLAGVSVLVSFVLGSTDPNSAYMLLGCAVAVLLTIAFFASRQSVVAIASAGPSIKVAVKGMGKEKAEALYLSNRYGLL